MSLAIETFSNERGGNVLYKALAHPLAAGPARELGAELASFERVAVYDPLGIAAEVALFVPLAGVALTDAYVQDARRIGEDVLGHPARPIADFSGADALLVAAFDAERLRDQISHLIGPDTRVHTLDRLRLPPDWLSCPGRYLQPQNFVANFVFFRDSGGLHTRLSTANYWSAYGAEDPHLCGLLIDADGRELARFRDPLGPAGSSVLVDSRAIRERFGLGNFCGQLFVQIAGAAGHDVFKYALDTYGAAAEALSCTHDANAWPAMRYAGLPLPGPGERTTLWVQNSHPLSIPDGALALKFPGGSALPITGQIGPFATRAVDVGALCAGESGTQVELVAGKHVVRPRYEIEGAGHHRIAHVNVVREDLKPDPDYWDAAAHLGRGYLLVAPCLPNRRYSSEVLITPMSPAQDALALILTAYDRDGRVLGERPVGPCPPNDHRWLDAGALAGDADQPGHLELRYDPAARGPVDGWFHAIFRYRDRGSGHAAETSFGSHMFNSLVTYKGEPQSYAGPPPGLSTRLYVRLGFPERRSFCHLIYPGSADWHPRSRTRLILHGADGRALAERLLEVPLNGSRFLEVEDCFEPAELSRAGPGAYALVRDKSCRLFGYHGLRERDCFSLDHLFGF